MEPVKNKKLTYLLLCAVAAVWGVVVYRVFFNEPIEDDIRVSNTKVAHEPYDQYSARNDTFKLVLDYRDPFTGKEIKPPVVVKASSSGQHLLKPFVQGPPPLNWSAVRYAGYIVNPETKHLVAIMSVDGIERMLSEGESLQGVKLLKNRKDSVLVSWMGKQKYIRQ